MSAAAPQEPVTPDSAATVSMPMPDAAATGSAAQTVRVEGDGAGVTQGAKRTLRIRKDGPPTTDGVADARTVTPLTAAAPTKAVIRRTDTVFNTFCVLNILIIGGSIGILTWQCIKHLWS